jgi:ubiquinone/menaquinone biosynthesis C-methylase UbiE
MAWGHSALVAEVYDMDLPLGHTVGDVEFHLRALKGTTGKVLEPATGNGRVLVPLLEAGYDAEGLDHSPDMLCVCRANCRARGFEPVLHEASMTSFVRPDTYAAIVLPAGSIRNVAGREGVLGTLLCFHRSLVHGGLLLIDVVAPRFAASPGPWHHWERGTLVWSKQLVHAEYDPAEDRTTNFVRYEKWNAGELIATELHRYCLQHWGLQQFAGLLGDAGFIDVEVSADYVEGARPTSATGDWTFRAMRP